MIFFFSVCCVWGGGMQNIQVAVVVRMMLFYNDGF